jgi:hypothetical protein
MKDYRSTAHSRTMTIGELMVDVVGTGLGGARFDTALASEFDVEVEFEYTPGYEGRLTGPMDMAEEPVSPECEITGIKASANVHFEGDVADVTIKRGADLMPLFSGAQIDKLTDEILLAIERERH